MKTFILALAVALSLSVAPANAETKEETCSAVANFTMAIVQLRDAGMPPQIVMTELLRIGLEFEAAQDLVRFVWSNPQLGQVTLGAVVYKRCMIIKTGAPA